jgi:hypothetical protein
MITKILRFFNINRTQSQILPIESNSSTNSYELNINTDGEYDNEENSKYNYKVRFNEKESSPKSYQINVKNITSNSGIWSSTNSKVSPTSVKNSNRLKNDLDFNSNFTINHDDLVKLEEEVFYFCIDLQIKENSISSNYDKQIADPTMLFDFSYHASNNSEKFTTLFGNLLFKTVSGDNNSNDFQDLKSSIIPCISSLMALINRSLNSKDNFSFQFYIDSKNVHDFNSKINKNNCTLSLEYIVAVLDILLNSICIYLNNVFHGKVISEASSLGILYLYVEQLFSILPKLGK